MLQTAVVSLLWTVSVQRMNYANSTINQPRKPSL